MTISNGFISFEYKLFFFSYLRLSERVLECLLGAVVTPSGQSVNQSIYIKSVRRRRIAIAYTYRAEENVAIYRYYTGNTAQP